MRKIELWYGALLHDIGKIVFRSQKELSGAHSYLGGEYIKQFQNLKDKCGIVESIKYHHARELRDSALERDSLAYITYMADNIASGIDRRDVEGLVESNMSFDKTVPLHSIFNVLNGNKQTRSYDFKTNETLNYPTESKQQVTAAQYSKILNEMSAFKNHIEFNAKHFNSLLQWTESYWSYIPSSTAVKQLVDISLYDHCKITCAVASCIYDYLAFHGEHDYCKTLFTQGEMFYEVKAYSLVSLDLSGVQDFIYNISGEKALKSLRARSFYLEMLLEVIIDVLLDKLEYSRSNLLYCGGGHAYLLVANTQKNETDLTQFASDIKAWFLKEFKTDLYLAIAATDCSGKELMNTENGYANIWKRVSRKLSAKKLQRYNVHDINHLNAMKLHDDRECKECLRSDTTIVNGYCNLCDELITFSTKLQNMTNDDFITVGKEGELSLPFGYKLDIMPKTKVKTTLKTHYKIYSKNNPHLGESVATNLWISNYFAERNIEQYAKLAQGIERLGVLRADVDNLGSAFASGIPERFNSLSRVTALSRKLSMFFKFGIDNMLKEEEFLATVIYAGGDDVFIIGAWDDVIDIAIQLRENFKNYTQGTLTLSAGIGMYRPKYPIYKMASETGALEKAAKVAKDNVTLWSLRNVYHWDVLKNNVLNQKLDCITNEFQQHSVHNKAFIYKMLTLLQADSKLNVARIAYLLGKSKVSDEFSKKVFSWISKPEDKKALITALEYTIYVTRKESDE